MSETSSSKVISRENSLWLLALFAFLTVLAFDASSKYWIQHNLLTLGQSPYIYPYGGRPIFKDFFGVNFSIVHATNRGAAWGVLADHHTFLLWVRIALIALLGVYTFVFNQKASHRIPLALILAGAVGNIADFFIYDHVVDMFKVDLWGYHYPVFNVADCAIFIGVFWLFFFSGRD